MKLYLITGIAGAVTVSAAGSPADGSAGKPNIVFIIADDLGYADLGCYGQKIIETPNIDALARNGIRFTDYYSGSPVSAPSRCVLLTGKHTGHAFIRGNHEWPERGDVWNYEKMEKDPSLEGQFPIPEGTVTFSRLLQNNGYTTACIGKWGLGAPLSEGASEKQGFDLFFGYNCQRQAHTYYPTHLWRNDKKVILDNEFIAPHTGELGGDRDPLKKENYSKYSQKEYSPALMLSEALAFIRESKGKPFLLHFTTTIPHVALQAPDEWVEKYRGKIGDEKPYTSSNSYFPCRYPRATYAAMVSYLDYQVGKIVEELKKLGLYENTIIFFTSDNGPTTTGGSSSQFFENALPFNQSSNRIKGSVYEGGIRVPMIVSWPAKIKKSFTSDHMCAAWDIFPTFCDIAGIEHPGGLDGITMLPLIRGKIKKQEEHEFLYWEFPERRGQQAVRLGKWKGIRENTLGGNMKISLYDLSSDLTEEHDVANKYPDVVKQIEAVMMQEHREPEISRFNLFPKN